MLLNVFHHDGSVIRHFWGSELFYAPTDPGQDPRHVGTLEPVWNLFDPTREGRGTDWDEQLECEAPREERRRDGYEPGVPCWIDT
jgi:predicted dithiol-disulfide oxidoreductase (DUF899 family)